MNEATEIKEVVIRQGRYWKITRKWRYIENPINPWKGTALEPAGVVQKGWLQIITLYNKDSHISQMAFWCESENGEDNPKEFNELVTEQIKILFSRLRRDLENLEKSYD